MFHLIKKHIHRLSVKKQASQDLAQELKHINEEMYKKSLDLAQINKTLSVLRKIDEIILGSVTNPQDIGQQVSDLLIKEAQYKRASIFLFDKKTKELSRIGTAEDESVEKAQKNVIAKISHRASVPLSGDSTLIAQSINEKKLVTTQKLSDVLFYDEDVSTGQAEKIQSLSGIKSSIVSPFVLRNEVIGAIVISLADTLENLSEYEQDLLRRLTSVIGIALDNALLYNKVEEANEKLKAIDKLKDEFVSLASHELRTPMTAIKSYTWMTLAGKGGELNEKQRYYMERAYSATDRLIKLVNDMLNISRIESGRLTLDLQPVHMDRLVQDVIVDIMPRANELGIIIKLEKEEAMSEVLADQDSIKEVLINLIGNSLKFTPKGGNITINIAKNDGKVETSVKDNGIGIEKEDMEKLFQKFGLIQGSYATNQKAQGTGLGLYICKQIVTMHGGKIWANSDGKNQGSTFTFTLKPATEKDSDKLQLSEKTKEEEKVHLIPTEI